MQYIHLQGIGRVPAKSASEFKPGESILFNYGYVGIVIEIAKQTDKSIFLKILCKNGIHLKRYLKTRLLAISTAKKPR